MTIAFWCVLAAALMPYVAATIAKSKPGFDNNNPRQWLQQQEGLRQRANAAQLNGYETFPLFASAVLIAQSLHAIQHCSHWLSWLCGCCMLFAIWAIGLRSGRCVGPWASSVVLPCS